MPKFDSAKVREYLLEGAIRRELAADFSEESLHEALTGWGMGFLETAIECILVGLEKPAIWLLEKSATWLPEAIAKNERRFKNTGEDPQQALDASKLLQYDSLAICKWLLYGLHDAESLRQAVYFDNRYYAVIGWERETAQMSLPLQCDAGDFESAIAIFEKAYRRRGIADLAEIEDGGVMSYVYCAHRLGEKYTESDLVMARDGFLGRAIPDLLAHGHNSTAARWMKLFFWNGEESREGAWKSVLRCYDYLPGVKR